jgi:hypothetical protein
MGAALLVWAAVVTMATAIVFLHRAFGRQVNREQERLDSRVS